MILRVWAMYHQSGLVFAILFTFFLLEITSFIVATAVQSDPRNLTAATIQILDFSFCVVDPTSFIWAKVTNSVEMVHGGMVCIFAIARFVKQSLQMYHETGRWQLNQYMNLLVKQGILYFFVYVPVSSVPPASSAAIQTRKLTNSQPD
ncbi:hypothetical protein HD554DRAFT_2113247 [Boletus coccyginus]|nr:hypothetical protein HD554DRAFT_2113247 [Boletus coccyginus]